MKLADALRIVHAAPPADGEKVPVFLACGFLPLHLATFLDANLRLCLPHRQIEIQTGIYGDLAGNLERLRNSEAGAGVVVFEWSDFDPRLGLRSLGGWGPNILADVVADANSNADRFLQLLGEAAVTKPLAVSLPTLPLPPISYQVAEQASVWQLQLSGIIDNFALRAAVIPNIKILNQQQLHLRSPLSGRLDVKSEFASGFPYRIGHAATLAQMLAHLVHSRTPKKGLITDLDCVFWGGLLGEEGIEAISWNLDQQSHIHALYQQLLLALSDSGVLIAVASKNDAALVRKAFEREDMIMTRDHIFPFEVSWQAKSQSIERILQAWNVSPDSLVFVDDSKHELAEVKSAFPDIECLLFPQGDGQTGYEFLETLRNLFGKESILEEDAIRRDSIRRGAEFNSEVKHASKSSTDTFLGRLGAELTLGSANDLSDSRAFELINKTNQFNLNGIRLSKAEFQSKVNASNAVSLLVSYRDKYGPLGKIAVMLGSLDHGQFRVESWVMSCRAFSRRIEHKCLEYLFEKLGVSEITFDFQPTERNQPVQEFLSEVLGTTPEPNCRLARERFVRNKPLLQHAVKELIHA